METIQEHIGELRRMSDECIECIDSNKPYKIPSSIGPGDMIAQGDIGLLVLDKKPVGSVIDWTDGDFKLAPGNTKGSRHTIPGKYRKHVTIIQLDDGDVLSDLAIIAKDIFDVNHPEHADHIGYPARYYRVRHQQNAQRQRVLD